MLVLADAGSNRFKLSLTLDSLSHEIDVVLGVLACCWMAVQDDPPADGVCNPNSDEDVLAVGGGECDKIFPTLLRLRLHVRESHEVIRCLVRK